MTLTKSDAIKQVCKSLLKCYCLALEYLIFIQLIPRCNESLSTNVLSVVVNELRQHSTN